MQNPIRLLRGIGCGRSAGEIDTQVRRYAAKFRRRLRRMSEVSPRCADLLFSFPAASVALVTRRRSAAATEALRLVHGGAPLAEVAATLQLPTWLRRLPPEAFDRPLPTRVGAGASDIDFGRRVIGLRPVAAGSPGCWLAWVLAARAACDDEFAVWVAGQPIFCAHRPPPLNALLPLAMFAWFSRRPELEAARLMTAHWTPQMGIERAANLTCRWLHRVLHDLCLALPASRSIWAQPRQVHGFDFVPLLTSDALSAEGARMQNCLATYTVNVVHGVCRLYSVRRDGVSLATLDVRNVRGHRLPAIAQLLARGNNKAPPEIHEAAAAWLKLQLCESCDTEAFNWGTPPDAAFHKHVWRPYASAIRAASDGSVEPPTVASLLLDIGLLCTLEKR